MAEITDTEDQDGKELLLRMLPNGFNYVVEEFTKAGDGFSPSFRLSISNKHKALKWVAMFEERTLTTFRVERTYPENTDKVVFKQEQGVSAEEPVGQNVPVAADSGAHRRGKKRPNVPEDTHLFKKAASILSQPTDAMQIRGDYVAGELRTLKSERNQNKVKRMIQKCILEVSVDDAETLSSSVAVSSLSNISMCEFNVDVINMVEINM